jgi:hypothetical protein
LVRSKKNGSVIGYAPTVVRLAHSAANAPQRNPNRASSEIALKANSVPIESEIALIVLEWPHFPRRSGRRFAGLP